MHIFRFSNLLKDDFDFFFINESPLIINDVKIFNLRSKNIFKYIKTIYASNIIHIHTGVWWLRCLHILISRSLNKKIFVTVHSLSNIQSKKRIFITNLFLKLVNKTIVVSDEISQVIKAKDKVIIPAFIPPNVAEEQKLPREVLSILENNKDRKIIVSNAFDLILHKGSDLYGLDLLIEVAKAIKRKKRNYKIIFILGSLTKNINVYESYVRIIEREGLEDCISIVVKSVSFVSLILKSDIVIRATNTDGDALTIREAIYLNKAVIASDIVVRPKGTVLFMNRNSNDLFMKIDEVLNGHSFHKTNEYSTVNIKNIYLEKVFGNS